MRAFIPPNGRPDIIPPSPPGQPLQRILHRPEVWPIPPNNYINTCMLDSTVDGGALTWYFDPDPMAYLLDSNMEVQVELTRGGQIAYPLYRSIGPLLIQTQLRTTYDLHQLAFFVQAHHREAIYEGKILHFIYPERDVDFGVYIRSLPQWGVNTYMSGNMHVVNLLCEITRDHTTLSELPLSDLGIPTEVEWIDPETAARLAESDYPGSTFGATPGEDEGLNPDGTAKGSDPPQGGPSYGGGPGPSGSSPRRGGPSFGGTEPGSGGPRYGGVPGPGSLRSI